MKLMTVLGARPQFIKAAAVSRVVKSDASIDERIIHTGQHYDNNMSDVFFNEMDIPLPDHRLNISGVGHAAMTGRMMEALESIFLDEKADAVMVYGDTNSTLAGALAASKIHIPVVHVEAGLRSFNMKMPEEINRILTDRVSDLLLCPTDMAVNNLNNEGYSNFDCIIEKSGDVMLDAALYYANDSKCPSSIQKMDIDPGFVLTTVHRAENTDNPERLAAIMSALTDIAATRNVIFPVHPRTRSLLRDYENVPGLHLMEPVGYKEMVWLLQNSSLVTTDSGGLQKEAYFFSKPCITMRDETEWVELVTSGVNLLVGSCSKKIVDGFNVMSNQKIDSDGGIYGGGEASQRIVSEINKRFS